MEVPLKKDEIDRIIIESSKFVGECLLSDSLIRSITWMDLVNALRKVREEERIHDFTFPSPCNLSIK